MSDYIVYSLAKSPLNRLMWSHYGGNHQGFSIEFDFTKNVSKNPLDEFNPLPVNYQSERPIMHDESKYPQGEVLLIKDTEWSYEDEYRIVKEGQGRLVEFNPNHLSSIILGARVKPNTKAIIQDVVFEFNRDHENSLNIYYCELSETKYELVIPGHPEYENRT